MNDYEIISGDCRDALNGIPDESVQCVVTSPPYWGLRDYGVDGQLGLEPTPDEYVADLVAIMREVRRVLRDDGTLWLNLGDSYVGANNTSVGGNENFGSQPGREGIGTTPKAGWSGLASKNLVGIPWRVAFALQADGWWMRSDIIWSKPNPMPESVRDRPTRAHEYVFLLTKSARYFYDAEAIREEFKTDERENYPARARITGRGEQAAAFVRGNDRDKSGGFPPNGSGRNKRSVWTITTQPYPEAHFAVFPEKLVEPCVLAGTSERGCCKECGESMRRKVELVGGTTTGRTPGQLAVAKERDTRRCVCRAGTKPCVVLDPFAGAGTVGVVCTKLGRDFIGIELNPEYCEMARKRIHDTQPSLF